MKKLSTLHALFWVSLLCASACGRDSSDTKEPSDNVRAETTPHADEAMNLA